MIPCKERRGAQFAERTIMLNTFKTPRLHAVRMAECHETMLAEIHADERVMATNGGVRSAAENRAYLERNIAHWDEHGFGVWVFLNAERDLVGRGGILRIDILDVCEVELNYSVAAEYWRQGYATEMATDSLLLGFEHLPVTSIIAFTQVANAGSRKVMEKVGMTYECDFTHYRLPHALYRIQKSEMSASPSAAEKVGVRPD